MMVSGPLVETDPRDCQLGVTATAEGRISRGTTWHFDCHEHRARGVADRLRDQAPAAAWREAARRGRATAQVGRVASCGDTGRPRPARAPRPCLGGRACRCEQDQCGGRIVKQTGSQRPAGRLWADDEPTRLVFLGSLALGDETAPLAYGDDPKRNMAGVLERIGPFKWRLVIPWPQSASKLDVFELTPVALQPEG